LEKHRANYIIGQFSTSVLAHEAAANSIGSWTSTWPSSKLHVNR